MLRFVLSLVSLTALSVVVGLVGIGLDTPSVAAAGGSCPYNPGGNRPITGFDPSLPISNDFVAGQCIQLEQIFSPGAGGDPTWRVCTCLNTTQPAPCESSQNGFATITHGQTGVWVPGTSVIVGMGTPNDDLSLDTLAGFDNLIFGLEGDDLITVVDNAGENYVVAGDGDDYVDNLSSGGSGRVRIFGGAGNDWLYGSDGNDIIEAGSGQPVSPPVIYAELLEGRGGNDALYGSTNAQSQINGGAGDDTLVGGALGDDLSGQDGDDLAVGEGGDDFIGGDAGDDFLCGNDGDDLVDGDNGNNTLYGDAGDDYITGGYNRDTVVAGTGEDTVQTYEGRDSIDLCDGTAEYDYLDAGLGNDKVTRDGLDEVENAESLDDC